MCVCPASARLMSVNNWKHGARSLTLTFKLGHVKLPFAPSSQCHWCAHGSSAKGAHKLSLTNGGKQQSKTRKKLLNRAFFVCAETRDKRGFVKRLDIRQKRNWSKGILLVWVDKKKKKERKSHKRQFRFGSPVANLGFCSALLCSTRLNSSLALVSVEEKERKFIISVSSVTKHEERRQLESPVKRFGALHQSQVQVTDKSIIK